MEEEKETVVEETPTVEEKKVEEKPKKSNKIWLVVVLIVILAAILCGFFLLKKNQDKKAEGKQTETVVKKKELSELRLTGNSLQDFDLYFLQVENKETNAIYSPLSIKYALEMLGEGANGESRDQIDALIGEYVARKYPNSANMSFANAFFIRDSFKDSVKPEFVNTLKSKYSADIIYDSFATPATLNNWVSEKTFKLIPALVDDLNNQDFVLVNALAIDMEWVNKIQSEHEDYIVDFKHEQFTEYVGSLDSYGYQALEFNGFDQKVKTVSIAAVANKYDIIGTIGEDKIRSTVAAEYSKWLATEPCGGGEPDVDTYMKEYMKEIGSNYKHLSSSTDFMFYDDENVKVFAKDLKQYNGVTLQYVGIMPKKTNLKDYVANIDAKEVNNIIDNIKPLTLDSFEDGYVTRLTGTIPLFNYEYELDLMGDLKTLGIEDVFDGSKADLSGLAEGGAYINKAVHKANIEFSNDGIKAAAATAIGGKGAADCRFVYDWEVPVKEIDISFNKPFMYIIRDKDTGEVWFIGTVYQPKVANVNEWGEVE